MKGSRKRKKKSTAIRGLVIRSPKNNFKEYEIKVIVDNSKTKNSPIIIETNPSYLWFTIIPSLFNLIVLFINFRDSLLLENAAAIL